MKKGIVEKMSLEELQEVVSACLDEIVRLKEENQKMKKQIDELTTRESALVSGLQKMIHLTEEQAAYYQLNKKLIYNGVDNIKYEMNDSCKADFQYPKFYDIEDTIDDIVNERKSMARFGDGEFALMTGEARHKFQHADEQLAIRLQEVIRSEENGMLIAIADNYGNLDKYNSNQRWEIRSYMSEEHRKQHFQFLNMERKYHNAYISRPYAMYVDNRTDAPYHRFQRLRRIWEGRDVIFVEGSLTRMGVGNDLFDNAAQIRRIIAPPVNAFDKYNEILKASLEYADADTLFLIALGPVAGVLAYDLYHSGYQALDIGHLDLEYEWYLKGEGDRCEVKNKYNNEVESGDIVEDVSDQKYYDQIIYVIEEKK